MSRKAKNPAVVRQVFETALNAIKPPIAKGSDIVVERLKFDRLLMAGKFLERGQAWNCLVITTSNPGTTERVFSNLLVKSLVEAAVHSQDGAVEVIGNCTILAMPERFQAEFMHLAVDVLSLWGSGGSITQVVDLIDAWQVAFAQDTPPSRQRLLGLWGELFLIHMAPNPDHLVEAWHVDPTGTFDFLFADGLVLEAKTTQRSHRQHHFSSGQVGPHTPKSMLLASTMTQRSDTGLSINSLKDLIIENISSPASVHLFMTKFLNEFDPSWTQLDDLAWDATLARNSVRIFTRSDLSFPAFEFPITEVTWIQDFDSIVGTSPRLQKSTAPYFS